MDRKNARQRFADVLGRSQLSEEEYATLRSPPAARWRSWPWWLSAGLSVGLAFVILFAVLPATAPGGEYVGQSAPEAVRDLSVEVVTNHIHDRPLDHEAGSIRELADVFDQLDFRIRDSRLVDDESLRLLGGRHCTLQGRLATQIVFRDAEGRIVSHYQAAYHPAFFGEIPDIGDNEQPLQVTDRGYRVDIWREDGVLMARASAM